MDKQVTSTPPIPGNGGGGGSGYLYLHYWPVVDWEPAINVDMVNLSISTASPPLGDYVQVRVSAVLVEEMLLKIKSSHKIC